MNLWRNWIEQHYFSLLAQADKGSLFAKLLLSPLVLLSFLYGIIFQVIKLLKKRRRQTFPTCFIMTVGNIVVGGTGKTPLIAKIVQEISDLGVVYIARGYGCRDAEECPTIDLLQASSVTYERCGDEATLLAKRFPRLDLIMSGRHGKQKAIRSIAENHSIEPTIVLLDDGLQHDEIDFDLQIVTIDAQNPYGYGWLLPRGVLREYPEWRLPKVDYIVITNCRDSDDAKYLAAHIQNRWNKPVIAVKTVLKRFFSSDGKTVDVPDGSDIYLFSGIANPDRIITLLNKHVDPSRIKGHLTASDHAVLSPNEVTQWLHTCSAVYERRHDNGACLISTEKDWVRSNAWDTLPIPVYFMEIDQEILCGLDVWQECLEKIIQRKKRGRG